MYVGGGGGKGGLNRFFVATILALSSAVIYTGHLVISCEGLLTHQCNISENIIIKRYLMAAKAAILDFQSE